VFLSEKKSNYSAEWRRKRGKKRIVLLFFILILAGVSIFYLNKNKESFKKIVNKPSKNEIIMELWENQKYMELINYCDSLLEQSPAAVDILIFRGFASFYEGSSKINYEDKLPFIDDSVFYLRKAIIFNSEKMRPQINYVLGRSYYHKGKYYADLSVKYLEKSVDEGYIGKDSYEYLALAHTELGNKEKSALYFELAAENNPSDILFSLLAQLYMDLGSLNLAEDYLIRSNNRTTNQQIEEKNLFLLGQIYEGRNDLIKAGECYNRIIQKNSKAADAYYKLGLLYEIEGDKIKARAEWRKALRIDPQHYGARLKLF